jgi:hypothetical protein
MKIGDRVRIIKHLPRGAEMFVGDLATIVGFGDDNHIFVSPDIWRLKIISKSKWWVLETDFVLFLNYQRVNNTLP